LYWSHFPALSRLEIAELLGRINPHLPLRRVSATIAASRAAIASLRSAVQRSEKPLSFGEAGFQAATLSSGAASLVCAPNSGRPRRSRRPSCALSRTTPRLSATARRQPRQDDDGKSQAAPPPYLEFTCAYSTNLSPTLLSLLTTTNDRLILK